LKSFQNVFDLVYIYPTPHGILPTPLKPHKPCKIHATFKSFTKSSQASQALQAFTRKSLTNVRYSCKDSKAFQVFPSFDNLVARLKSFKRLVLITKSSKAFQRLGTFIAYSQASQSPHQKNKIYV